MDESDDDAACEAEPVREIVETMINDGYEAALLVFLAADGTSGLWHRGGLDAEDFLRFLLAAEVAREVRH